MVSYICQECNYFTSKISQYNRHLLTEKHKRITANNISFNDTTFNCECGKSYKHKPSLYNHKRKCTFITEELDLTNKASNIIDVSNNTMILELIKQNNTIILENKELKNLIIDLASKVGNNNNNTYISNNSFNLNFFLNETCKDAISINEFIQNIEIQLKELENIGINGYVIGVTDIITNRLKQLDITKRPVHCTDLKRETLYIKDENTWNKDKENEKMRNMITKIANKSYRSIPRWREEYPECKDPENNKYDFCIKMMRNVLGEIGEEQIKLDDKVIKNIAKQVIVDKSQII
jgi:frataxin-like iron-binding protein CyaY